MNRYLLLAVAVAAAIILGIAIGRDGPELPA